MNLLLVLAFEWELALREELVSDDTQCPDVDFRVVVLTTGDLWRHIVRSAGDTGQLRPGLLSIEMPGQTKVDNAEGLALSTDSRLGQHHILELQVEVHDPTVVQVLDAGDHLREEALSSCTLIANGHLPERVTLRVLEEIAAGQWPDTITAHRS